MIKNFKKRKWSSTSIALLLIIFVGLVGLTGCSSKLSTPEVSDTTEINDTNNQSNTNTTEQDDEQKNSDLAPDTPDESVVNDATTNETKRVAYVKSVDTENKTITVDEVEFLLYPTDKERITEIGLTEQDLFTGYYIYNEEETLETISYEDTLSIKYLENVKLVSLSVEEFVEYLKERDILCNIIMKNNVVTEISEQYLP